MLSLAWLEFTPSFLIILSSFECPELEKVNLVLSHSRFLTELVAGMWSPTINGNSHAHAGRFHGNDKRMKLTMEAAFMVRPVADNTVESHFLAARSVNFILLSLPWKRPAWEWEFPLIVAHTGCQFGKKSWMPKNKITFFQLRTS